MTESAPQRKKLFRRERGPIEALLVPTSPIKAIEVFTPSIPAERGFVGRKNEMKDLRQKGFNVPGTQVVIWGESGAGKSSLVKKVLEDMGRRAVQTACTPDATYETILEAAFSGTGAFYIAGKTEHTDVSLGVKGSVGSELIGAKIESAAELSNGTGQTLEPISKPQLNPQTLLRELGVRGLSWVIEDFHKVSPETRVSIAHALKVFSDGGGKYPNTTVVVLGVSESVDELVAPQVNVNRRLIDIEVPPLHATELGKILDAGENLLNVDFSRVRQRLLNTSVGIASVTHALALNCCDECELLERTEQKVAFSDEDFDNAVEAYARTRSGDLKARFEKALMVHRERKFANTKIILRVLTQLPEEGGTVGEIFKEIRGEYPSYPQANLTKYLRELQGDDRGALVRKTTSNRYRFDEPLQQAYAKAIFGLTGTAAAPLADRVSAWTAALDDVLRGKSLPPVQEWRELFSGPVETLTSDQDDEDEDNSWMENAMNKQQDPGSSRSGS